MSKLPDPAEALIMAFSCSREMFNRASLHMVVHGTICVAESWYMRQALAGSLRVCACRMLRRPRTDGALPELGKVGGLGNRGMCHRVMYVSGHAQDLDETSVVESLALREPGSVVHKVASHVHPAVCTLVE